MDATAATLARQFGFKSVSNIARATFSKKLLAFSSKPEAEDEATLLEMGWFDFITKPNNPVRSVARTKSVCALFMAPPRRFAEACLTIGDLLSGKQKMLAFFV